MPQLSVIVPVYKVEKYLQRCVDSILAQTITDFELILIDDGSPDRCGAICDAYAQGDSRIRVFHQNNKGLSAARNFGIDWACANSGSEWITLLDSDDWIHPRCFEALLQGAAETGLDTVIATYKRVGDEWDGTHEEIADPVVRKTADYYYEERLNAIVPWGKIHRKKCFQGIRYPIGRVHEDEFTTYKLLFQSETVAVIPTPLYYYYINHDGIMLAKWKLGRLDSFDAVYERSVYFKRAGLEHLRLWEIKSVFTRLYTFQKRFSGSDDPDYKVFFPAVNKQMRKDFIRYRKDLKKLYNRYERFSLMCLASNRESLVRWVIRNDFEPIQNILRKIKRC